MKVLLLSAYPEGDCNFAVRWLRESAVEGGEPHTLCDDAAAADVVLFVEHHPREDPFFLKVATHPVVRRFREKCFLYHDADDVIALVPGIYPSVERSWYDGMRTRPGHYIAKLRENKALANEGGDRRECSWLFSFMGATLTHPVRKQLLALEHPRGLLQDTGRLNAWNMSPEEELAYNKRYATAMLSSKFVLCPRGRGPSSYRLYETMQMARVPVIISDEWVPVEGPDWESFSMRVAERDIANIPELLERAEQRSEAMGGKARTEWESWFSKPATFRRVVDQCAAMLGARRVPERWARLPVLAQFLRPVHLSKIPRYFARRH